jgi:hypothetical protein
MRPDMPNIHALSIPKCLDTTTRWKERGCHITPVKCTKTKCTMVYPNPERELRRIHATENKYDRQLSSHYLYSRNSHLTILAPLPIMPIPPFPACKLCLTISSAAAAAASLSFCRLRSRRYLSASGRMRKMRKIMSSLGSA